jgi:hypothetical protein
MGSRGTIETSDAWPLVGCHNPDAAELTALDKLQRDVPASGVQYDVPGEFGNRGRHHHNLRWLEVRGDGQRSRAHSGMDDVRLRGNQDLRHRIVLDRSQRVHVLT